MRHYKFMILIIALLNFASLNADTLRIEAQELANNLSRYKIIDTRTNIKYLDEHISKAINFPINLTYKDKKKNGKIVQLSRMQKIVRELGIKANDDIIIYDDGSFFDAARLFWTLEVYGFKNVKLLNGGMKQWKQKSLLTTSGLPTIKPSNYIVSVDNNRLATKFTTQLATKNPKQAVLDARKINAYQGETSMSNRFGHIPTAIHFPATNNIDYNGKIIQLKSKKNMKALYAKISKKNKVVVYCAIGRIAALNYFALRELGYNVANYDASWKEWGNDFQLPIVNPSKM